MNTLRFKTNINCGSCIRAATPTLNRELGANNWQVDTSKPEKPLTVYSDHLTAAQIQAVVEAAGFTSFPLN